MILRSPWVRWGLLLLIPALAAGLVLATRLGPWPWNGDGEDLPVIAEVPEFSLTDQNGDPFGREDLAEKVWISDFIFTRCSGPCPRMTLGMRKLQDVLEGAPGVKLVSFTVDPDYDTPEILRSYAEGYGADTDNWTFLTGPSAKIRQLARGGFYLASPEFTDEQGRVVHSIYFALVDQKGRIRGYYNGLEETERARLAQDVKRLLEET